MFHLCSTFISQFKLQNTTWVHVCFLNIDCTQLYRKENKNAKWFISNVRLFPWQSLSSYFKLTFSSRNSSLTRFFILHKNIYATRVVRLTAGELRTCKRGGVGAEGGGRVHANPNKVFSNF